MANWVLVGCFFACKGRFGDSAAIEVIDNRGVSRRLCGETLRAGVMLAVLITGYLIETKLLAGWTGCVAIGRCDVKRTRVSRFGDRISKCRDGGNTGVLRQG